MSIYIVGKGRLKKFILGLAKMIKILSGKIRQLSPLGRFFAREICKIDS